MRVGLHIGKFHWPGSPENIGPKLAEIARTADEVGMYSLWVMDHLFQLGTEFGSVHGPVDAPMLEGYSAIAYLAGVTRRIKLGLLVTCPYYRYPGMLVKTASTIDVLSGGRTYFGLGAGWFQREALGLGTPFPSLRERYERLEETLRIAQRMWAGDTRAYEGKHYQLAEPLNVPQPLSRPHPPIIIGGDGEKKTLRLVAAYADACNFVLESPSALEEFGELRTRSDTREDLYDYFRGFIGRKLSVLQQHCQEVGRSYEEIERTIVTYIKVGPGAMDTSEVVDLCRELATMGIQHVIFNIPNVDEIEPLVLLGRDVIPVVSGFA